MKKNKIEEIIFGDEYNVVLKILIQLLIRYQNV